MFKRFVSAILLFIVLFHSSSASVFRATVVDKFNEAAGKVAEWTSDDSSASFGEFKRPRYQVLEYETLLSPAQIILSVTKASKEFTLHTQLYEESHPNEIFIPPETRS